ncbi:MAG TPA: hypothetical protein VIO61_01620 [Anaerolineaceae bacterium]
MTSKKTLGWITLILLVVGFACQPPGRTATPGLPPVISTSAPATYAPPSGATPFQPLKPTTAPTLPKQTPSGSSSETQYYQDPDGFYSLEFPKGWINRKVRSEQQFCTDPSGKTCLVVSLDTKAYDLKIFTDAQSAFFASRLQGYQEIIRQNVQMGSFPAGYVEMRYTNQGAIQQGFFVTAIRHRVGFLLLASAPEKEFAALRQDYFDIVQSFKIIEFTGLPPYASWQTVRAPHVVLHYLPGSWIAAQAQQISETHEQAFNNILRALQVSYNGPVHVYLYASEPEFYLATGRDAGFAIDEAAETHVRWFSQNEHQTTGHELTHVITYWTLGRPAQALLGEGIAVCLDQENRDFKAIGRELMAQKKWLPLSELLGDQWGSKDIAAAYSQSGVFARFLLDQVGTAKFKQIYPAADLDAATRKAVGMSLAELERELIAWVGK